MPIYRLKPGKGSGTQSKNSSFLHWIHCRGTLVPLYALFPRLPDAFNNYYVPRRFVHLCIVLSMSFSSISSWSQWIQNFYKIQNNNQNGNIHSLSAPVQLNHLQGEVRVHDAMASARPPAGARSARQVHEHLSRTEEPKYSGMVFLRLNFIELTRFHILSICIIMSIIALTDLLSWSLLNQLVCFMVVLCRFRSLNKKQVESARRLIDNGCFRRCPMMATLSGRAGIGFWWVSRAYRSVEKGLYPEIFLCFVSLDVRCCTYVVPRLVSILDPYLPVFPTSKKTRRSLRNAVASLKIERPRGTYIYI